LIRGSAPMQTKYLLAISCSLLVARTTAYDIKKAVLDAHQGEPSANSALNASTDFT